MKEMNDGIYNKQICFESFLTLGQIDKNSR